MEPRYAFAPTLLRASGDAFLAAPHALQTEAFGTVNLVILARDVAQMTEIASRLEGNLTGCIYSDTKGTDDAAYTQVATALRPRVGRLLNDKMPTGVAVSPAMNHGGPYPATGHPGFTAVGIPASLLRFAALRCYDNVRPHRLPPELQDKNPTGKMWRFIDGEWTQRDVGTINRCNDVRRARRRLRCEAGGGENRSAGLRRGERERPALDAVDVRRRQRRCARYGMRTPQPGLLVSLSSSNPWAGLVCGDEVLLSHPGAHRRDVLPPPGGASSSRPGRLAAVRSRPAYRSRCGSWCNSR